MKSIRVKTYGLVEQWRAYKTCESRANATLILDDEPMSKCQKQTEGVGNYMHYLKSKENGDDEDVNYCSLCEGGYSHDECDGSGGGPAIKNDKQNLSLISLSSKDYDDLLAYKEAYEIMDDEYESELIELNCKLQNAYELQDEIRTSRDFNYLKNRELIKLCNDAIDALLNNECPVSARDITKELNRIGGL